MDVRAGEEGVTRVDVRDPKASRYATYVLVVLCVTNILAVADRTVMSLLLEPIRRELHASDTSMSLLTGAAFVLFYALFGIPIARWADRGDRRKILAFGVAVWSVMTMACGMAQNFLQMAIGRAGVGMGEAAGTPTSMSLIADYYRSELRPQVIAIFNVAVPVGTICITPLLGLIADHYGWRAVFLTLGVPGVLVALLVRFTVREPVRGAMDADRKGALAQGSMVDALKTMWASPPFMLLLIGTAITGLGAGTTSAWGVALAMRAFDVTATQIASIYVPLSSGASIIGTLMGGFVTTWAVRRTRDQRWLVLLPAIAAVLTVPGGMWFAFGSSWAWMILGGMIGGITIGFRTSPYMALMLDLMPANCRGMAASASVVATSVVGFAGGPLVVGILSDMLRPSLGDLGALRAAIIFAPVTMALGCIPFFLALRYFDANGVKARGA